MEAASQAMANRNKIIPKEQNPPLRKARKRKTQIRKLKPFAEQKKKIKNFPCSSETYLSLPPKMN